MTNKMRAVAGAVLALWGVVALAAAPVTITAQLTSFQSALSPYWPDGDGTLNGQQLVLNSNLPGVAYPQDPGTLYPQSQVVQLAAGTTSVEFHYTSLADTNYFNSVSFTAGPQVTVSKGDVFKAGTVTYQNGFWYPYAKVGLQIQTHSTDPTLDGHTFTGSIVVAVSSPPVSTNPQDNADYFYLTDANGPLTSMGSVRVYERAFQPPSQPGNVGSADLYVRIGSLVPTRFDNPSTGAFLSASLDPVTSVPEPGTWALALSGLMVAAVAGCRRR